MKPEDTPHHPPPTRPVPPAPMEDRIRPAGGFRTLHSFQTATIIYDGTVHFCERFVDRRSRTVDQMVQAARSGRQNIAEGSRASAASSQTELRLVSVARASLDELLLDYEDFLRQRRLPQWAKDDPRARAVRAVGRRAGEGVGSALRGSGNRSCPTDAGPAPAAYAPWLQQPDPAIVANALICLIHQANYLLDQQLRALEREFIQGGGYSEKLAAARLAHRLEKRGTAPQPSSAAGQKSPPPAAPLCPVCGEPMVLRTARQGAHAGNQFWGCTGYPRCRATRPV